ncbi:MAG: OmpA family protein, partial [Endomicrobia bacterium]|nr:OmpA family protein [Endomicrobiia bacterium]
IPCGVRASGVGGNLVAVYDTAEGLFYNPAVSVFSVCGELTLAHHIYFANTTLQQLSCTFPLGVIGFGLIGNMFSTPDIDTITNYTIGEKFSLKTSAGGCFLAVAAGDNLSFGFGVKYAEQKIYNNKLSSFLYNTGILLRSNNEMFTFGCSLTDFSPSKESILPTSYNIGVKLKLDFPQQATKINFIISSKIDYHTNKPLYSFGVEHWGSEVLGLRVGYVYDKEKQNLKIYDHLSFFTAGITLKIGNFSIDYAYLPNSVLGATHNIGLSLRFKTKKEIKQVELPCELKVDPVHFSPNDDGYLDNTFFQHDVSTYSEIVELSYTVKNTDGQTMFIFISTYVSYIGESFYTYDGKNSSGEVLPEGKYTVEFVLKDKKEDKIVIFSSKKKEFVVDTTPPTVEITVSSDTFSPDNDGVNDMINFNFTLRDNLSDISKVDVGIYTLQGKKVYTYKVDLSTFITRQEMSWSFMWDGKDEIYNTVVPPGSYKLVCNSSDIAGNKVVKEVKFNVYIPPKQPEKIVEKVIEKQEKLFYIKGAKVTLDERGIVITYPTDELFIKDTNEINPKFYDSLLSLSEIIKESFADKKISIEGHTDSVGETEENKNKSSMYAWSVYSYFVKFLGFDGKQFDVKGWGEEKPIASNKSKLGRAQNRRIEIILPK